MGIAEHLPALVIVTPLLFALIIPIAGMINRALCWVIAIAITFACLLMSISLLDTVINTGRISYHLGAWDPPWGIEYVIDYLNGFVLVIVSFIFFMVTIYARKSVAHEINKEKIPTFYSIYMLLFTGLLGITITGDIFNLYVFIEIASLTAYTLVAMGKKRRALMAGYNYLILGTIAATFILLGIGYLYMVTGSLNMADLREILPGLYHSKVVLTAFAFLTVGLSIKLALFPLHIWLPNAHSECPSVMSAMLAAAFLKVNVYALLRIMFTVFKVEFDLEVVPVTRILLVLSCIAIIAGSVLAIAQTKIKRMLAYSSVGQMGYIVLGAALINKIAMTGGIIHLLNHALMKSTLFLVAGAIVYKTGIEDISGLRGLGKKMPFSMAAFTIGSLSMIGTPLTVGFISKWYLAIGALKAGMWFIVPVILLSSLLTAVYFWRVIEAIYFKPAVSAQRSEVSLYGDYATGNPQPAARYRDEAPPGMLIPILILAGLCIFFGIAASIPLSVAEKAANMLLGGV